MLAYSSNMNKKKPEATWKTMKWGGIPPLVLQTTLSETNIFCTWKWMVGRRSFPFGMAYLAGANC